MFGNLMSLQTFALADEKKEKKQAHPLTRLGEVGHSSTVPLLHLAPPPPPLPPAPTTTHGATFRYAVPAAVRPVPAALMNWPSNNPPEAW